jgi:hypothetical protein
MTTRPADTTLTFRLLPGLFPVQVIVGTCLSAGLVTMVSKGSRCRRPLLGEGTPIVTIGVVANVGWWMLLWNVSYVAWRFTLLPERFVARNRVRGHHVDVPWQAIVSVQRVDLPWWQRWFVIHGVSAIETNEGHRIFFWLPMTDHEGFVEELRARALNVRQFDPYPAES